jgi:hypothetical protein
MVFMLFSYSGLVQAPFRRQFLPEAILGQKLLQRNIVKLSLTDVAVELNSIGQESLWR